MTISIRLDLRLKTTLQQCSSKRDLSLSVFVREAISKKLKREE